MVAHFPFLLPSIANSPICCLTFVHVVVYFPFSVGTGPFSIREILSAVSGPLRTRQSKAYPDFDGHHSCFSADS